MDTAQHSHLSVWTQPNTHTCPQAYKCMWLRKRTVDNNTNNVRITWHWGAFANHCCGVVAIRIAYLCVCARPCMRGRVELCMGVRACSLAYPACSSYTPYCDIICGIWLHHIFRHYLIKDTISEKKMSLTLKCVFWFSLRLLFEIFLIIRRIQRDIVINVKTFSCKVAFIFVWF